jgi:hypothetical protein
MRASSSLHRAYEMQSGCVFITLLGAGSKGYASLLILNMRSSVKFNLVRRKINVKRSCERLKTLNEYQRLDAIAFCLWLVYRKSAWEFTTSERGFLRKLTPKLVFPRVNT